MENKPILVYWLPFLDDREMVSMFSKYQDFVCCVSASSGAEAIEKAIKIAKNTGVPHVKIIGLATGREEWIDEKLPLRDRMLK